MVAVVCGELGSDPSPSSPNRSRVPHILSSDRNNVDAFLAHYQPVGPVEHAIVLDLARQALDMEKWATIRDAVQRQSVQHFEVLGVASGDPEFEIDETLALVCSVEGSDRAERHLLAHSRNFYRALHQLETLQARRKSGESALGPPVLFRTESDCETYLSRRFANGHYCCEQCGQSKGFVIATRKVWECGECRRQTGLRSGTVMSGSPIPLLVWFAAIGWIVWRPTIETSELAERIGIRRLGTVRTLANRIRQALASNGASARLAALDEHYSTSSHLTQVRALAESRPPLAPSTTGGLMS